MLAAALLLVACTEAPAASTNPLSTTTITAPVPTSATSVTTTTTVPATTTTMSLPTTTTAPAGERTVDLTTPCGVVAEWSARAAEADWDGTWDLTHPVTQNGLPDLGIVGVGDPDEAYQNEMAGSVAPWAAQADVQCTFFEFGASYGDRVGVVSLMGTVALDTPTPVLRAAAWPVRTRGERWLLDTLGGHLSLVVPSGPFEMLPATTGVVLSTPAGTFDTLLVVDGRVEVLLLGAPADDRVEATWVPTEPFEPGPHVVVAATMLENGLLDAVATTWEVAP